MVLKKPDNSKSSEVKQRFCPRYPLQYVLIDIFIVRKTDCHFFAKRIFLDHSVLLKWNQSLLQMINVNLLGFRAVP